MSAALKQPDIDALQAEVEYLRAQIADLSDKAEGWALPGPAVKLTQTHRRFVRILHNRIGRPVSYGLLYDLLYGKLADEDQPLSEQDILKVFVCHIRKALTKAHSPFKIETIWGVGFRLVEGRPDESAPSSSR